MPRKIEKKYFEITEPVVSVYVNDIGHHDWFQIKVANKDKLVVNNIYDTDVITYAYMQVPASGVA